MQKYVIKEKVDKIEENLKQQDLPQLSTLRQGVIVLSRQWKNTLYNPMLFEHQYKNKLIRPINVAFSMPPLDEVSFLFFNFVFFSDMMICLGRCRDFLCFFFFDK